MFNAANTIKLSVSEPVVRFVVVEVVKDEDRDPSRQEVREACQTVRQALNAWHSTASPSLERTSRLERPHRQLAP